MEGRVVVVTGSNVGIGLETAVGLAALGATTVLACRNQEKAAAAAAEVRERTGSDAVQHARLDLADLQSVLECSQDLRERFDHIDVLTVPVASGRTARRRLRGSSRPSVSTTSGPSC